MANFIAAYIAHGHRPIRDRLRPVEYPIDDHGLRQWKRIFCLFSMVRAFSDEGDCPRFILISDHAPPVIDSRMIGFYLERMNVEIHRIEHIWRPYASVHNSDHFVFDVLEHLESKTSNHDAVLIFSGNSLAVNPVRTLFDAVERTGVLCVEKSDGELAEDHERALRDRMAALRHQFGVQFPHGAIRAASNDFIGLTHERLRILIGRLRILFMKNLLRASRGEDCFQTSAELLAALFAQDKIYHPNLSGLSDRAAAMPDNFSVANLPDVPVIIPGYGREPDIDALFQALLGDRFEMFQSVDREKINRLIKRSETSNRNDLFKPNMKSFQWRRQAEPVSI